MILLIGRRVRINEPNRRGSRSRTMGEVVMHEVEDTGTANYRQVLRDHHGDQTITRIIAIPKT